MAGMVVVVVAVAAQNVRMPQCVDAAGQRVRGFCSCFRANSVALSELTLSIPNAHCKSEERQLDPPLSEILREAGATGYGEAKRFPPHH